MTTPAHPASEQPHVGPYRVIERLATGGMGTTYLARREGETALRVLKLGHVGGPLEGLIDARLGREAAVGARLRHPNVAALVDAAVTEQGRRYLVFEYITGPSLTYVLESWAARGVRPPVDVAVGLALQILDGLHHIHEARDEAGALLYAVHRDVGPNNVMLELSGVPKLIDLGLVRDARSDWRTESRVVVGTAQYVAPEIASGGAKYADRRADLYSLGILLYEMLLAEPMFAPGTGLAAMLGQLIDPHYPRPSERRADVPAALDEVVMRALAPKPDERWPHAAAFAAALRGACAVAGRGRIAAFLAPELEAYRTATAGRAGGAGGEPSPSDEVGLPTSLGSTPHGTQVVRRRPSAGPPAEAEVLVSPEAEFNSSEMLREVLPTRLSPRRGGVEVPSAVEVGWPKRRVLWVGALWTVVCVGGTWGVAGGLGREVIVVGDAAAPAPSGTVQEWPSSGGTGTPAAAARGAGLVVAEPSATPGPSVVAPEAGVLPAPRATPGRSATPGPAATPAPSASSRTAPKSLAPSPSSAQRRTDPALPATAREARALRERLERGEPLQPLIEAARALAEAHGADRALVGLIRRSQVAADRAALERALRAMEQTP